MTALKIISSIITAIHNRTWAHRACMLYGGHFLYIYILNAPKCTIYDLIKCINLVENLKCQRIKDKNTIFINRIKALFEKKQKKPHHSKYSIIVLVGKKNHVSRRKQFVFVYNLLVACANQRHVNKIITNEK